MYTHDTICAIATAPGGAIGIVRVSGSDAISIADRIFTPIGSSAAPLAQRKPYTVAFGHIKGSGGEIIDEVLVSVFRAPHSYTGEDSVEISCHGSAYILQQVVQQLIANGCRAALPGEYTQRAFLNGKMDLSQAEAVADLIAASTTAQHDIAMKQMRGGVSLELARLREKLLRLTSLLELEIDFSDHEELEFANRDELCDLSRQTAGAIEKLVGSFSTGQTIKNGVPVAIVGATNAGKSSLLNRLVGEERAIVSDIHGTTRDVIEDTMVIDGIVFRFIDTAGLRQTDDAIEQLGIKRSYKEIEKASIVLYVIDSTRMQEDNMEAMEEMKTLCRDKHLVVIYNKADIAKPQIDSHKTVDVSAEEPETSSAKESVSFAKEVLSPKKLEGLFSKEPEASSAKDVQSVVLSAKTGEGMDSLRQLLSSYAGVVNGNRDVIVSNVRHYEALSCALSAINRVSDGLSSGLPSDLISQDLRDCLFHLAEITGGEITTSEVLENVFRHFCIGK